MSPFDPLTLTTARGPLSVWNLSQGSWQPLSLRSPLVLLLPSNPVKLSKLAPLLSDAVVAQIPAYDGTGSYIMKTHCLTRHARVREVFNTARTGEPCRNDKRICAQNAHLPQAALLSTNAAL